MQQKSSDENPVDADSAALSRKALQHFKKGQLERIDLGEQARKKFRLGVDEEPAKKKSEDEAAPKPGLL